MSDSIDQELVKKVAHLARLDLNDSEIEEFTGQLMSILDYVAKMNELDTDEVEPLAHCLPVKNRFRADEPGKSLDPDQALSNAPQRDDDFFRVPRILDQGGGV